MARTAAVVGTATATRNAVNRRQAEKNAQAYAHAMDSAYGQQSPPPQQYAPPPDEQYYAPPPAPAPEEDMIAQLERLGALKAQGLLTDEEFAAAKQKLLA
jgi:type II secretory pathway pseudopilin PulG